MVKESMPVKGPSQPVVLVQDWQANFSPSEAINVILKKMCPKAPNYTYLDLVDRRLVAGAIHVKSSRCIKQLCLIPTKNINRTCCPGYTLS